MKRPANCLRRFTLKPKYCSEEKCIMWIIYIGEKSKSVKSICIDAGSPNELLEYEYSTDEENDELFDDRLGYALLAAIQNLTYLNLLDIFYRNILHKRLMKQVHFLMLSFYQVHCWKDLKLKEG